LSDKKVKIVRLEPMPPWISARLEDEFDATLLANLADRPAAMLEHAADIRGVATPGQIGANRALLEALPNLEIVSLFSVGWDGVDVAYCKERGIIVTNTPDVLTHCVADMGMALTLAALRRVVEGDRYVRAGRWEREGVLAMSHSPRGRTLGIVGLGRIGLELAARAQAFGMNIAYHNRQRRDDVDFDYHGNVVSLAAASDVLALTCPGGKATFHLIDEKVLAALGSEGILVNIARGSVVDEPALIRALQDGVIGGAALDVFEAEPKVPAAFMEMENVILQPHHASASVETRTAMGNLTVDNLVAHFSGKPVLTPVI
jgi:hydroxypyruvate reductase